MSRKRRKEARGIRLWAVSSLREGVKKGCHASEEKKGSVAVPAGGKIGDVKSFTGNLEKGKTHVKSPKGKRAKRVCQGMSHLSYSLSSKKKKKDEQGRAGLP